MAREILLDELRLSIYDFQGKTIENSKGECLKKVSFNFDVKGGREYHDVTSHLYQTTFEVNIPETSERFKGTITKYSTSRTDFTDENGKALFSLELTEVK